jgi:hypothetical protein
MAHSMKGFVFTLDALFALIVASLGASMLIYMQFTSPGVYQSSVQEAYNLLQSTLRESVAGVCNNVSLGTINGCRAASGTGLYSFGSYNSVQPYQSALQAIANLYINPYSGPFASALLNAVYPSTNATIFINGAYAPSMYLQSASFNGVSSFIAANTFPIENLPAYTVNMWVYLIATPAVVFYGYANEAGSPGCPVYWMSVNPVAIGTWNLYYSGNWYDSTSNINVPLGSWQMVTVTLSGGSLVTGGVGTLTVYLDGGSPSAVSGQSIVPNGVPSPLTEIGGTSTGCTGSLTGSTNGNMANVQLYSTALSASQITQLYQNGLGGAPVSSAAANVVAWWPLDGNANDYTTYANNGIATNVIYGNSLSNTYIPASLSATSQVSSASIPLILNASGTIGIYNVSAVIWR